MAAVQSDKEQVRTDAPVMDGTVKMTISRRLSCFARLALMAMLPVPSVPLAAAGGEGQRAAPNIVYILCRRPRLRRRALPQSASGKIATPQHRPAGRGRGWSSPTPTAARRSARRRATASSPAATPGGRGCKAACCGGYSPPLIEPGRLTVPALLQAARLRTACIGKWHLGLDMPAAGKPHRDSDGGRLHDRPDHARASTTTSASARRWTCRRSRSSRTTASPQSRTVEKTCGTPHAARPAGLRGGRRAAHAHPQGGRVSSAARRRPADQPFFLYLPLNSPHTPHRAHDGVAGQSGLNAYGDFVMQTDAAIGQVLAALDEAAWPATRW